MKVSEVIAGLQVRLDLVISRSNGELTSEIALYRAAIEYLRRLEEL